VWLSRDYHIRINSVSYTCLMLAFTNSSSISWPSFLHVHNYFMENTCECMIHVVSERSMYIYPVACKWRTIIGKWYHVVWEITKLVYKETPFYQQRMHKQHTSEENVNVIVLLWQNRSSGKYMSSSHSHLIEYLYISSHLSGI